MKTMLISLGIATGVALGAMAAGDGDHAHDGDTPHDMRGEIMKSFGENMKALGAMASGKADFDAADAQARLVNMNAGATRLRDEYDVLWPEGSTEGDENEASPVIWEKPDEFMAAIDQFISDTTLANYPADGFELGDELGVIGKNCKSCHEDFRIKK